MFQTIKFVILVSIIAACKGEIEVTTIRPSIDVHLLKLLKNGQNPNLILPQYTSNTPDFVRSSTQNQFKLKSKICSLGMWALYSTLNFGEGVEELTTVVAIKSVNIYQCSASLPPGLISTIQSVSYLGNADYKMDGVTIYSSRAFLGASWTLNGLDSIGYVELPRGISGFPLGSIAITGSGAWRFCSDASCSENGQSICVDNSLQEGNLYMNLDTRNDFSVQWPTIIRAVQKVSSEECALDFNPSIGFSFNALESKSGIFNNTNAVEVKISYGERTTPKPTKV